MNLRTISHVIAIIMITGCTSGHQKIESDDNPRSDTSDTIEEPLENKTPTTIQATGNPEMDRIFVDQAIDAWLYFKLSDFKSYQPIIRTTRYDSIRNIHTQHLRYRVMNEQGGMVTLERDFEVDLNRPGDHGIPFFVKEIFP